MNSVRLYYIKHQGENELALIDALRVEQWLSELSEQKQASIQRLLHYQNRLTSLAGLRLLRLCAQDEGIGNFKLSEVQYPDTGKPFWGNKNNYFDFNISHSGNLIVISTSATLKVGVDVEQIRQLKRLSFKMVMSAEELAEIQQTPVLFFDLWSKKEAVVKAADTVGLARMRDVNLKQNMAVLDEDQWFLKSINLDNQYAINIATSKVIDELIVKQIQINNLK
ncbi:MAG: 4'-phosphopantetheinyl transferase family protein [Gammaproteobacteria bacterium]